MAQDHYSILGIARDASADEIKKAYRRLAHKHHPDKKGGDEEKFKEINEAYQVLSNKEKRAQYDQFGQSFESGSGGGNPFGGFSGQGVNFEDLGGINDLFEQFFGGGARGRGRRVRRGQDVGIDLTISFQESAKGTSREVSPRIYSPCSKCRGSGAEPGTPIITCATCSGAGSLNQDRQTAFGIFRQTVICPDCQGEGKKPKTKCSECHGEGRVLAARTLEINIPAGIADGQTVRITGKGEAPPRGGVAGDLYVNIHVQPDARWRRVRDDIASEVHVSFADAALGTRLVVSTINGDQELKVTAGTQPGTEFRLRGQGFPHLSSARKGDHIVTLRVQVPKHLSAKQKQLLKEFKDSEGNRKSFFG